MEFSKEQSIIEAMLFAAGREVSVKELTNVLELSAEDIDKIILNMKTKYEAFNSGLEIIKVNDGYQLCTKKEFYEYIYPLFDNRAKPNISNAALETLSIIAYNPNVTRSEIEAIRGVNADGTVYKLLEFDLIEEAGKLDAPGKPTMYRVTNKFMKMFGITSLEELPELPRYKLDENEQIVIDDIIEAPMPAREGEELEKQENNEE
ncbi:MAG TPA: SMC-Scp complex subunit ScpB [Candidatus Scatovivens faecipullorum]|nr:SMC-Scp complex subunit ScpB [Candidatus Scatovivens faecipullorum]